MTTAVMVRDVSAALDVDDEAKTDPFDSFVPRSRGSVGAADESVSTILLAMPQVSLGTRRFAGSVDGRVSKEPNRSPARTPLETLPKNLAASHSSVVRDVEFTKAKRSRSRTTRQIRS